MLYEIGFKLLVIGLAFHGLNGVLSNIATSRALKEVDYNVEDDNTDGFLTIQNGIINSEKVADSEERPREKRDIFGDFLKIFDLSDIFDSLFSEEDEKYLLCRNCTVIVKQGENETATNGQKKKDDLKTSSTSADSVSISDTTASSKSDVSTVEGEVPKNEEEDPNAEKKEDEGEGDDDDDSSSDDDDDR